MPVYADEGGPLRIEHPSDGVVAVWMDVPRKRNALDEGLVEALLDALGEHARARAFVLGSTDARCFCAGADLGLSDAVRARVSDRLYGLYRRMLELPAPILVAVDGAAIGGGAQLATAGDLRVGSASTRFRFVGPGHGLAVGAWGLPSLVGRGRAIDLCLTMRSVDGEEALRAGLLDRLVEDPRRSALDLATEIAALDQRAAARVKRLVRDSCALVSSLDAERDANRTWSGSVEGLGREAAPRS